MKYYYVYILKCADNSYYTGVTNNLEKRVSEHQNGDDPNSYTYRKRPVELVWFECYNDINQAIEKEKQIKGWSRKKKEALIKEDFDSLIELSKNSILRQAQDDILLKVKKIVITGPESSGKTTLSEYLSSEYKIPLVKEYAREYLSTLRQAQGDKSYTFEDVIKMAKMQLQKEQEAISQNNLLFLDTDLTVFYVWIKEKYGEEIDWINTHLSQAQNKIYLLCDVDIPWRDDDLREHPNIEDRKRLFTEYQNLLERNNLTYHIISGDINTRQKKCREIIDKTFLSH